MSSQKTFFKKIYKIHTYVGLFVAFHFAIFALTGLALLFKHEILGLEKVSVNAEQMTVAQTAQQYEKIIQKIKSDYPQDRPLALFPDEENPSIINARLGKDGVTQLRGARRLMYDLNTAEELVQKPTTTSGFFDTMLELHRELFLGSNGKLYLGFVGLLYIFVLISGFFIYGKFMKGRSLGDIRAAKIPKMIDWHKFIGVTTFGWSLMVALSGVFLAFNGVLIKYFQYQSLKHLSTQYQIIETVKNPASPLQKIIETTLQAKPETMITYVSFPDTEFGIPGHFLLLVNGKDAITERISELVVVNATSAQLAQVVELPLYLKIVLLSEPLHFGDYGGIVLKIIWALFTLGSLAVVILGITSFAMKRQNRQEPVTSVKSSKFSNSLFKHTANHPYRWPVVFMTLIWIAAVSALFVKGFTGQAAVTLLLVPLVTVLFLRRQDG